MSERQSRRLLSTGICLHNQSYWELFAPYESNCLTSYTHHLPSLHRASIDLDSPRGLFIRQGHSQICSQVGPASPFDVTSRRPLHPQSDSQSSVGSQIYWNTVLIYLIHLLSSSRYIALSQTCRQSSSQKQRPTSTTMSSSVVVAEVSLALYVLNPFILSVTRF